MCMPHYSQIKMTKTKSALILFSTPSWLHIQDDDKFENIHI